MADNATINNNSGVAGTSFDAATDDVAGKHYQKIKVYDGTLDSTNGLTVNASGQALVKASDTETLVGAVTETAPATDTGSSGLNGRLQRIAQRLTSLIALLPTSLGANGGLKIEGVASGTAVPVSLASVPSHAVTNAGTFAVQETGSVSTDTHSNVASSATNVTLLASNASRKAATIYNDSTQILYVKFGATASATSHKIQMAAGSYYEFPKPIYTGIVDGLWASANGSARITES